jgi:hypothetical protein
VRTGSTFALGEWVGVANERGFHGAEVAAHQCEYPERKGPKVLTLPTKEDPAPQSRVQNRTVGLTKVTNSGCQVSATTLRKGTSPQNNVQVELVGLDLQASEGPRVLNESPFQGAGSCSARSAEVRGALSTEGRTGWMEALLLPFNLVLVFLVSHCGSAAPW